MLIGLVAGVPPAFGADRVPNGPPGKAFYSPSKKLVQGPHGTVIWARRLHNGAALSAARGNVLALYRSRDRSGTPVAVSGSIAIPRGQPPRHGWPVVSWAYGVVGLADRCAPTRAGPSYPYSSYLAAVEPTLNHWVRAGYAVVRTDYAGLGTPGVYPYLVGRPTARSVLDVVRAARHVDGSIARRFVSAGHSSGGHAAIWAAGRAREWTPELRLRGTVAYAPSSHIDLMVRTAPAIRNPSPLSVFGGLVARGFDAAYPDLHVPRLFSDRFRVLYPQTITKCLPGLQRSPDWMALAPADIIRPDVDLAPYLPTIARSEPIQAGARGHVLVVQGTHDVTVLPAWTEEVADRLRESGAQVDYHAYDATHESVLSAARADVSAWIRLRLSR